MKPISKRVDLQVSVLLSVFVAAVTITCFLFNMSHGIRTPMNALSFFIIAMTANAFDEDKKRSL